MKHIILFSLFFLQTLSGGLVEYIFSDDSMGKTAFAEPIKEEDANGPLHLQLRYELAQKGWDIEAVSGNDFGNGDVIIFNNTKTDITPQVLADLEDKKKILITWEPPTISPHMHEISYLLHFDKVLTWNTSLSNNSKFIRFFYPAMAPMEELLPNFIERYLVCMINANKTSSHPQELYSERRHVINYYEKHLALEFHLFGKQWRHEYLGSYMCPPVDKISVLKNYRFSYAYENYHNDVGYITEKIFDCFRTGTIPIYLGATNITDFIPEDCFINANKFANYKELHEFIDTMSEFTWKYYQANIQKFLDSPKAEAFTTKTAVATIMNAIFDES